MPFRILIILIIFAVLTENKYVIGSRNDVSPFEKLKIVLSNPLKYARSLLHNAKPSKQETSYILNRSTRESGDFMRDTQFRHHYILINKPSRIPCSFNALDKLNTTVLWKRLDENQVSRNSGHKIDSNGYLNIDNVKFSDMGEYRCLVPGKQIKVYLHKISVISMPKIQINVKMRYTTTSCEDSIRSLFERAMMKLLRRRVCYTTTCHINKVEAICLKKKQENFFETKMVFNVYKLPTESCGITCTSKILEKEALEIHQAIEQDILKYGEVTIPAGIYRFRPKIITQFLTNFYCDPDFVLSSDFCEPCKPGTLFVANKCQPCPVDSYNPHFGSRRCYACPENKETFIVGSTSVDQCIRRNNTVTIFAAMVLVCLLGLKVLVIVGIKMYFSKRKLYKKTAAKENILVAEDFTDSNLKNHECSEDDYADSPSPKSSASLISTSSGEQKCTPRTDEKGTCTSEDLHAEWVNSLKTAEAKAHANYIKMHAKNLKSEVLMPETLTTKLPSILVPPPPPPPPPERKSHKK